MMPQTARARYQRPSSWSKQAVSLKASQFASFATTKDAEDQFLLQKELNSLRTNLKDAVKELARLKTQHEKEVEELRNACTSMRQEIEALRTEKTEAVALQAYGIDDYSSLAQEVIRLRTELDRVTYLYTREKRRHSLHTSDSLSNN
jgi:uncharacterized protein (DUF3084 family)